MVSTDTDPRSALRGPVDAQLWMAITDSASIGGGTVRHSRNGTALLGPAGLASEKEIGSPITPYPVLLTTIAGITPSTVRALRHHLAQSVTQWELLLTFGEYGLSPACLSRVGAGPVDLLERFARNIPKSGDVTAFR
jgi:hypothetical protein